MKNGQELNVGDGDVDDIKIEVFDEIVLKDGTKKQTPRRYEKQYGWKDDWEVNKFYENQDFPPKDAGKKESWEKYKQFISDWKSLVAKKKVPIWYKFDPTDPDEDFGLKSRAHNSLKGVDEWKGMYDFLKKQKWIERDAEQTEDNKNKYTEKSQFVVDCSQLLGIGGEAVVIRKDVREKVKKVQSEDEDQSKNEEKGQSKDDRKFEALKIIPIMKHNFESEKLDEMKNRVEARHDKADPEFNRGFMEREKRRKIQTQNESNQRSDENLDSYAPAGQKEDKMATSMMQNNENMEMNDNDAEIAENNGTAFKHDNLMEYSNMQLDFIKVFGKKVFVMVIGKFEIEVMTSGTSGHLALTVILVTSCW